MAKFDKALAAQSKIVYLPVADCVFDTAVLARFVLLLTLILCCSASAQNDRSAEYTRSSQPTLLSYPELVALSEQETIEPALSAKLNTLLTTPFVNNEAYFAGIKPLRSYLQGTGPSLQLVQWNIERELELDDIKLVMTDKNAFLAKVHSEAASSKDKEKPTDEELNRTS